MTRSILFLLINLLGCRLQAQEPQLILPMGHTLGVAAAVFSPDGKRMVTAAIDNIAKIWEIETGRLLANLKGHKDSIYYANYSPDGKKIITSCWDGTAKIWDANSALMLADLTGHTDKVYVAQFSPDGKKALTSSHDATIKVWDAATGKLLQDLKGHTKPVWIAWFSPDGKKIISASEDSTAKIWDVATGKMLADLRGHRFEVLSIEFSPDGKKAITAAGDSTAKIWDAETGILLKDITVHKEQMRVAHFSPDGKKFVTASDDGDVKIWDAKTYSVLINIRGKREFKVDQGAYYFDFARAANFSSDGKKLLTVYRDSATNIWDVQSGKLLTHVNRGDEYVNDVFFSKDGKRFALALAGAHVEIYDWTKGDLVTDIKGKAEFTQWLSYSPDGKRMLIPGSRPQIPAKLLDAATGALITFIPGPSELKNFSRGVFPIFTPDGKKLMANTSNSRTIFWDAFSGAYLLSYQGSTTWLGEEKMIVTSGDSICLIKNITDGKTVLDLKRPDERIRLSAISGNGRRIVTYNPKDSTYKVVDAETGTTISQLRDFKGRYTNFTLNLMGDRMFLPSGDSIVRVWNAGTGSLLFNIKKGPDNPISFVNYSPDGKKLITFSDKGWTQPGVVKVLDGETGTLLHDLKLASYYSMYQFSPDGKKITYEHSGGGLRTWDFEKKEFVTEFRGHKDAVMGIGYSKDGKKILTASQDWTAKIWDAETGKLLHNLEEHGSWVSAAVFSPDGKKITTISLDNTIKIWNAETGNSLYTFVFLNDDYLVLDKYNHYDGTEAARKLLYFSCGTEIIELDQVKDQLWVPNLIERIENGETINAAKLSDLNICNLTPVVDTIGQSAFQYRFRVTPRMGGLGATIVYVNGIEVKRYTQQQLQQQKDEFILSVDKKELQKYFLPKKENVITVKSLTAKNSISSRSVSINEKGNEKNDVLPNLYAVVVGVSDYKGEELDLKFAAKEAVDIANAIDMSAKKLLNTDGKEHVFIYRVHTGTGRDKFPEKNGIRGIFTEIGSKALPNDILLIFFAGHGVVESEKNQFYFLTADASGATVAGALKNVGISTEELAEWIKPQVMKAQKRILIFDACNSGQAIKEIISFNKNTKDLLASRGDDNGKQIKAIEKLNEKSGMFILAASASDQKAYEIGKYNQGALTYSLLRAIKEQPDILEDRQFLNISRWFNAAEKSVNELARETGTRQQPQIVSTTNFNIGLVDDDVRNKIVLPFEKHLVTRSDFRNTELRIDNLKLRTLVDNEIDDLSGNDNNALLLFSPEYDGVNVYAISGDYTIAGNDVSVSIILTKGGTEIKTRFEIRGVTDNTNNIAKSIAQKVADWFKNNH